MNKQIEKLISSVYSSLSRGEVTAQASSDLESIRIFIQDAFEERRYNDISSAVSFSSRQHHEFRLKERYASDDFFEFLKEVYSVFPPSLTMALKSLIFTEAQNIAIISMIAKDSFIQENNILNVCDEMAEAIKADRYGEVEHLYGKLKEVVNAGNTFSPSLIRHNNELPQVAFALLGRLTKKLPPERLSYLIEFMAPRTACDADSGLDIFSRFTSSAIINSLIAKKQPEIAAGCLRSISPANLDIEHYFRFVENGLIEGVTKRAFNILMNLHGFANLDKKSPEAVSFLIKMMDLAPELALEQSTYDSLRLNITYPTLLKVISLRPDLVDSKPDKIAALLENSLTKKRQVSDEKEFKKILQQMSDAPMITKELWRLMPKYNRLRIDQALSL